MLLNSAHFRNAGVGRVHCSGAVVRSEHPPSKWYSFVPHAQEFLAADLPLTQESASHQVPHSVLEQKVERTIVVVYVRACILRRHTLKRQFT